MVNRGLIRVLQAPHRVWPRDGTLVRGGDCCTDMELPVAARMAGRFRIAATVSLGTRLQRRRTQH